MPCHVACEECGTSVSSAFARVFGNQANTAFACPGCATWTAIRNGAATSFEADGTLTVSLRGGTKPAVFHTTDGPSVDDRLDRVSGPAVLEDSESSGLAETADDKFAGLVVD